LNVLCILNRYRFSEKKSARLVPESLSVCRGGCGESTPCFSSLKNDISAAPHESQTAGLLLLGLELGFQNLPLFI
jgi:hypothetical protein